MSTAAVPNHTADNSVENGGVELAERANEVDMGVQDQDVTQQEDDTSDARDADDDGPLLIADKSKVHVADAGRRTSAPKLGDIGGDGGASRSTTPGKALKSSNFTESVMYMDAVQNRKSSKDAKASKLGHTSSRSRKISALAFGNRRKNEIRLQLYALTKWDSDDVQHIKATLFVKRRAEFVDETLTSDLVDDEGFSYVLSSSCEIKKQSLINRFNLTVRSDEKEVRILFRKAVKRVIPGRRVSVLKSFFSGIEYEPAKEVTDWVPIGKLKYNLDEEGGIHDNIVIETQIESVEPRTIKEIKGGVFKQIGVCAIHCEKIIPNTVSVRLRLGFEGYPEDDNSTEFIEIYKVIPSMDTGSAAEFMVYKSAVSRSNQKWPSFELPLRQLCNGEVDHDISIKIREHCNSEVSENGPGRSKTRLLASLSTTVREICAAEGDKMNMDKFVDDTENQNDFHLIVTQAHLQHFASATLKSKVGNTSQYQGIPVLPPTFTRDDQMLDMEEFKRARHPGANSASSQLLAAAEQGKGTWLQNKRAEFKYWQDSKPLERFIDILPLMSTVKNIGMKFSSSTEACFIFFAFLIGLNICFCALWLVLVIIPFSSDKSDRTVKASAALADLLAAITIFRKPEGGETSLGTWYGDYGPAVARNYTWATVGGVLITFFVAVQQSRDIFNALIESGDQRINNKIKYSSTLFGGWDYKCSSKTLQEALKSGQNLRLRALLREEHHAAKRERLKYEISTMKRNLVYARRALFFLVSIGYVVMTITVIYYVATRTADVIEWGKDNLGGEQRGTMLPSIITTIMTTIVLPINKLSVKMEHWNQLSFETSQIIYRTFAVKAAVILTLYYSTRRLTNRESLYIEGEGTYKCNQDLVANTFLKLIWVDIIVDVFTSLSVPVTVLVKRTWKERQLRKMGGEMDHAYGKPTFKLAEAILSVVYRQMMVWIGTPFCPILPLVAAVGGVMCFYVRSFALLNYHRPNPIPWEVFRARWTFMKVTLLAASVSVITTVHFLMTNFVSEMEEAESYNLNLCCGPHITDTSGIIGTLPHPTAADRIICSIDGSPLTGGHEVLSTLVKWGDLSEMAKLIIGLGLSPVTLLVVIILLLVAISLLQKEIVALKSSVNKLYLDAELTQQATYKRLEEAGMLHLLE